MGYSLRFYYIVFIDLGRDNFAYINHLNPWVLTLEFKTL